MNDETLKKLIADAPPGPWNCDDGHVRGGRYGVVICTPDADHDGAKGRLIAAAPVLAADVLRLRDLARRLASWMRDPSSRTTALRDALLSEVRGATGDSGGGA